MYIFLLGLLVVLGCIVYIYISNNKEKFVRKEEEDIYDDGDREDGEKTSSVIYLPVDIEQEKEKRKKRR